MEIVFLPYKAAMWDSLESVWLAAVEDPQCDVYVIPIPYYDKDPNNGTLGQMYYEGNQYPEYVPVVDWQSYDFENRRPDVIYVHNPYDEYNYSTSVHPDFYSKRLKEFTKMLVYIPYFCVIDDMDKDLCVLPGVLYADRVIVQSEKVRQTYISEFKNAEEAFGCAGQFGNAEEKFIALGSPKFDKVLNTKPEDCKIPDEWRELIDGHAGARKKVILYNTTLRSILKGDEKYLQKIRSVLEYFRGDDRVVLLWRPHPLSGAIYQAMRPQFLEEYESIVSEYRQQGFGIYDDTPDIHRAIAISDAYYGDGGSLVALFEMTGKPAMIQNLDIPAMS